MGGRGGVGALKEAGALKGGPEARAGANTVCSVPWPVVPHSSPSQVQKKLAAAKKKLAAAKAERVAEKSKRAESKSKLAAAKLKRRAAKAERDAADKVKRATAKAERAAAKWKLNSQDSQAAPPPDVVPDERHNQAC